MFPIYFFVLSCFIFSLHEHEYFKRQHKTWTVYVYFAESYLPVYGGSRYHKPYIMDFGCTYENATFQNQLNQINICKYNS
jgi:hypothetical protein